MMNKAHKKNERALELDPLRSLTVYPILPSLWGELKTPDSEKKGRSLMPNYVLESKVNKLYDLLTEIEEINEGDEDVEWCVGCMKDHIKTLSQIAEDYRHYQEYAH